MADQEIPTATHNSPRIWLLTASLSPLAVRLIRQLLTHGDCVAACLPPLEIEHEERSAEFRELINECTSSRSDREGWKDRIRGIRCDGRTMSGCGAAIAEAVDVFGRIDILLCCKSEGKLIHHLATRSNWAPRHHRLLGLAFPDFVSTTSLIPAHGNMLTWLIFAAVIGTVEELATNPTTRNLARDQFETIFFSQVNFIKATLPLLRAQQTGHILVLTSTGGHIGTPHMSMYTAATWALEGFCDSLAYEIAPFNIKLTIVQPSKEIQSLTNRLTFAPQIPAYTNSFTLAPSIRDMLSNVLNSNPETAVPTTPPTETSPVSPEASLLLEPEMGVGEVYSRYPKLPPGSVDKLVMETVLALTAIGGHENPPSRHIVGSEGAIAVKEKLRTITEEMEDFIEAGLAVDIFESKLTEEAREDWMRESPSGPSGAG